MAGALRATIQVGAILVFWLSAAGIHAQVPWPKDLPRTVGEAMIDLPVGTADDWSDSDGAIVSTHGDRVEISYDWKEHARVACDYAWPDVTNAPERLRFRLRTTAAPLTVEIWAVRDDGRAMFQFRTTLPDTQWHRFEVFAQNPIHRFHHSLRSLRFVLNAEGSTDSAGVLEIADVAGIAPVLVEAGSGTEPPASPREPMFNTWGQPSIEQLRAASAVGITLHMIPVRFTDSRPIAQRLAYIKQAASDVRDVELGLAFMPSPPPDWMAKHPERLVRNSAGEVYDRPGGAFTSPWHPDAIAAWQDEIRQVLIGLRDADLLDRIRFVELCPGEEGEVSFDWSHVWAFDPHARAAYQHYLRTKYGRIEKLNADWGRDFPGFEAITPPEGYQPDREHAVFADFYRLSMLRYCVTLGRTVQEVHPEARLLWLTHSVGAYPQRFFAARYPLFYAENLRRLGLIDTAQMAALDWQSVDDVRYIKRLGVRVVGEIDVLPSVPRLDLLFDQSRRFEMDGVYVGVIEPLSGSGSLTELGRHVQRHIVNFRSGLNGEP